MTDPKTLTDELLAAAAEVVSCWRDTPFKVGGPISRLAFAALATREQTASTGEPKPIATLHDDGYFTWAAGVRPPYLSSYAGWQMDVYAAGFPTEQLRTALAAPVEQAGSPKPEWSAYMQHPEWIANNRPKQAGSTPDETPDTARLNWLDAHSKESSIRFDDHTFKIVKAWAIAAHPSFAIRDAIDAAMKAD